MYICEYEGVNHITYQYIFDLTTVRSENCWGRIPNSDHFTWNAPVKMLHRWCLTESRNGTSPAFSGHRRGPCNFTLGKRLPQNVCETWHTSSTATQRNTVHGHVSYTGSTCTYDVLTKLQYDEKDYININLGNDRANVSLVVRAIQHPMNTYRDLDFLVPKTAKVPNDVKKSFVYADSVVTGTEIEQRLYENAPKAFREQGIIWPYSAAFSSEHRAQLMSLFKSGVVRILICTDAAGMVRSYTKSIKLSVNKLTFVLWSRAAIFRISTLLFSGNYRHQFLHLFREPAELHEDTEGLGLLFCLWKSLCTRLI